MRCSVETGYERPVQCKREATHIGTDEDGADWGFCAKHARDWAENPVMKLRPLAGEAPGPAPGNASKGDDRE